ncbi:MAG: hypothetical protein BWY91_01877 [bacterium ADurb.BinA028]|nr:MAG: hypothetical protein BWY91_01877 [bacterium ADurb.BinA028]
MAAAQRDQLLLGIELVDGAVLVGVDGGGEAAGHQGVVAVGDDRHSDTGCQQSLDL